MNGYFQVQRRFFSHWLWKDDRVFSRAEAFLDLLQLAAFTHSKKVVGSDLIKLAPGEIVASERFLAGRWKWSTTKVRAYLTLLEADGMVTKEKKQGTTVLNLLNYDKYRSGGSAEKAQINQGESSEKAGGKQIEEGENKDNKGRERPRRPTLPEAIAAASEVGITADIAQCWLEAREANDWMKGTNGGGTTPVGPNWRSDLSTSYRQGWPQEMLAKAKQNKTNRGKL